MLMPNAGRDGSEWIEQQLSERGACNSRIKALPTPPRFCPGSTYMRWSSGSTPSESYCS
jgi:hypothetical protein